MTNDKTEDKKKFALEEQLYDPNRREEKVCMKIENNKGSCMAKNKKQNDMSLN